MDTVIDREKLKSNAMTIASLYIPEDYLPTEVQWAILVGDASSMNHYELVYNLYAAGSALLSLDADKYSDDGVSYQDGLALSAVKEILPVLKDKAKQWDLDNGGSYIGFVTPQSDFNRLLKSHGF